MLESAPLPGEFKHWKLAPPQRLIAAIKDEWFAIQKRKADAYREEDLRNAIEIAEEEVHESYTEQ